MPNSHGSLLTSLTIAGSNNSWQGSLDIANDKLAIEVTPATKAATLATLQNQVTNGLGHTSGIFSTQLPPQTALAVVDNAALPVSFNTFAGVPVDRNSILMAPEHLGDANIDGHVDLNDLNIVLNNLGTVTSNWTNGNFDYAAAIDLNDLNDVLNNLGVSYANNGEVIAAEALLQASPDTPIPEPASLGFAAALPALLLQRRKWRKMSNLILGCYRAADRCAAKRI